MTSLPAGHLFSQKTNRRRADANCARVRAATPKMKRAPQGAKAVDVTISIGIATLDTADDNASTILKRADQALYRAKRDGRNRVVADAA